jgi:hypothetical protein
MGDCAVAGDMAQALIGGDATDSRGDFQFGKIEAGGAIRE